MILVTGSAGFIGFHAAKRLLADGKAVVGVDNLSPYYDVRLKQARLDQLLSHPNFEFVKLDITDYARLRGLFTTHRFTRVLHLAAQAGVRYSLTNPAAYIQSNVVGFGNVLEASRQAEIEHLVYASSSSVYGANTMTPFSVHHGVNHPLSLYGATKKANELMAHSYSHLYRLPTTGLRFFTVYGPWGRPDMAMFLFARAITRGEPITLFNNGQMRRDFTYIDDIVEGALRVLDLTSTPARDWTGDIPDPATSAAPYRLYNIGNHSPVQVTRVVELIERAMGRRAKIEFAPLQPGDVPATFADVSDLVRDVGFKPQTTIEDGVRKFVDWYVSFYSADEPREEALA